MSELLYEKQGMIAKIIINRPEKRNALNSAVIHGIDEALKQAAEDPKVRVVILGGAGEKAFTAGFDLKEAMEHNITGVVERREDTSEEIKFFMRMWNFPKPIVAAIQGYCIGGGITLAMLSDMVIASEDASFGNPEIILGYVPEFPMEVWKMPFNNNLVNGDCRFNCPYPVIAVFQHYLPAVHGLYFYDGWRIGNDSGRNPLEERDDPGCHCQLPDWNCLCYCQ